MDRETCLHLARAALAAMQYVNRLFDEAFAKCEAQKSEQTGRI